MKISLLGEEKSQSYQGLEQGELRITKADESQSPRKSVTKNINEDCGFLLLPLTYYSDIIIISFSSAHWRRVLFSVLCPPVPIDHFTHYVILAMFILHPVVEEM